jgi:sugar O-acyltransferase (sialic acid O-acetyltransferase NeuD family)
VKVVIIGAGGHGAVVADILLRMRDAGDRIEPVAFVDEAPEPGRRPSHVVQVISGGIAALRTVAHDAVIVAIGDNAARRRLSDQLRRAGVTLAIARHPASVVAPDVDVGPGTVICAGAVISPAARIGASVILNIHAAVDHHGVVGDCVHIAGGGRLCGHVVVGEGTLIGAGSTVLTGVHIGRHVSVAPGSVITKDLPDGVHAAGAPARVRRSGARADAVGPVSHAV